MERRPLLTPEQKEAQREVRLGFLLDADTGAAEQEFANSKRTLAELLMANPAFKSEKAERALQKLKETLKSADQNLPEELKNELRHERKDNQTLQAPVHIGTVVSDAPVRQPGLASMKPQQEETTEDDQLENLAFDIDLPKPKKSLYRQAVIGGFGAAVTLIILLFLFLA